MCRDDIEELADRRGGIQKYDGRCTGLRLYIILWKNFAIRLQPYMQRSSNVGPLSDCRIAV